MNPSRFFLALAVLSLTAGTTATRADDTGRGDFNGERHFEALLLGANEVPPISSRAFGTLRATLNHDETELTFTLRWENVTADITQAHIHFGIAEAGMVGSEDHVAGDGDRHAGAAPPMAAIDGLPRADCASLIRT